MSKEQNPVRQITDRKSCGAPGKSDAWRSGYHCGSLISKVPCPFHLATEQQDWEAGFLVGRADIKLAMTTS